MSKFGAGFMSLLTKRVHVEAIGAEPFEAALIEHDGRWLAFQQEDERPLWMPIHQIVSVQEV